MRSRALAVVLAVLALAAGALVAAPSAWASAYAITSIALDPTSTTVVGLLGTAYAHVSVGVRSDPPVASCAPDEPSHDGVIVLLSRVGPTRGLGSGEVWLQLALASGTRSEGTWTGTWRIGSGFAGTWQIRRVSWCNGQSALSGDDGYTADPSVTNGYHGTVVVTASAPPRVTFTRTPAVAVYGSPQRVTVRYTNARGTPLGGRNVAWGSDTECGFYGTGSGQLRLDSDGRVTVSVGRVSCLILTQPQAPSVTPTTTVVRFDWIAGRYRFKVVRAVPVTSRFTVGTAARVAAYVWPNGGRSALQVMVGRTWRTISSSSQGSYEAWTYVPANVRASLVTGRHLYRLLASFPGAGMVPTAGATFSMTGV